MDERIVVAIDGSHPGRTALAWALERARRDHSPITLATVVEDVLASTAPEIEARRVDRARHALQTERAQIEQDSPELTVNTELAYGSIPRALKDMSEHCDLLVVGTHKNGIIKEAILGSLGIRLAATAICSVAIIPEHIPTGRDIVVGIDDTAESLVACEFAAKEANATGGQLIIICAGYVANPLFADLVPPVLPERERVRLLAHASEQVLRLFPTLPVQTRALDGPPQMALLEASGDAGLLVVGYHKRSKLVQLFEGSVAHDVLVGMSVPAIVVRDKPAAHTISANPASATESARS